MVGCCVTLLFSLVDPHLWIFSSRHRQHLHNFAGIIWRMTHLGNLLVSGV